MNSEKNSSVQDAGRWQFMGAALAVGVLTINFTPALADDMPSATSSVRSKTSRRPDIIFLMTDQQRWDALGSVNPLVKTPTLDQLAKQGISFRQAVIQYPMCVPSRYSMMVGFYPSQLGVRVNSAAIADDKALPAPVLPELLRRAGYQTAGFGKTHWNMSQHPSKRGFEVRAVVEGPGEMNYEEGAISRKNDDPQGVHAYGMEYLSKGPYGPGGQGVKGYLGVTSQLSDKDQPDGWVAGQCLKFLDTGVDQSRPLFLYLSFQGPHAPLVVPGKFEKLYDIEQIPDIPQPPWLKEPDTHLAASDANRPDRAGSIYHEVDKKLYKTWEKLTPAERRQTTLRYWASCSWLDNYFGEILNKLKQMGRLDNALIIFCSDHGEMLGERRFRFTKCCLYDSAIRVPLILAGTAVPEKKQGTVDNRPAELVDLIPTIMSATGLSVDPRLPGLDLFSERRRAGAFTEYHGWGDEIPQTAPAYSWRKEDWKLIMFLPGRVSDAIERSAQAKGELYDLRNDPNEWNNLYDDPNCSAIREQMKTELLMHLASVWSLGPRNYHFLGPKALTSPDQSEATR